MTPNPWERLPHESPFVLAEDAAAVAEFNADASDAHFIHLELLPEPFLGDPLAPVVLLNLNPGFKATDLAQHQKIAFANRSRENLLHAPAEYPFYLLDPKIERTHWWERKLRPLIAEVGQKVVARSVFCIEYFPYHSCKYRNATTLLQSQIYGFALLRRSLANEALIIIARGERRWMKQVPELASYARLHRLNSAQNVTLSPKNCPTGYSQIIDVLKSVRSEP